LMIGTVVLLATGLQQAAQGLSWTSQRVFILLVLSGPFAAAFFAWQWYATMRRTNSEPVFPWRICESHIQLGLIVCVHARTIHYVFVAQIPQRLTTVNSLSSFDAGVRLLAFAALVPTGSAIAGALVGKLKVPPCWMVLSEPCSCHE
ncbi:hypothetical protein BS50DRAFT_664443, partial [Corynespora cassiicola Philippines]